MTRSDLARYRWIAPDGRKGRWRKTIQGAVMSAVATRYSHNDLRVRFCVDLSLRLWDGLKADGWTLQKERRQKS